MAPLMVPPSPALPQPPRLLDELRQRALDRFGRPEPAERHVHWVRRFILFRSKRHPRDLGVEDVRRFLEHLASSDKDPLRSIEQAREALAFLYEHCLHINLGELPFPQPSLALEPSPCNRPSNSTWRCSPRQVTST